MNLKNILVAVGTIVVSVVISVLVVGGNNQPQVESNPFIGAEGTRFQNGVSIGTNTSPTSNGLKVGDNGRELTKIGAELATISGTTDTSHAASTTKYYYASVTGVTSGDVVLAQFATTSGAYAITYGMGWAIVDVKASSTAGFVDFAIANMTGSAKVPSAPGGFGSTTNIFFGDY